MFQSFCVVVVSSSFSIIRVFLNPSVCSDSTTFPSNTASSLCHHHPFIRTFYIFSLNLFNLNFFPFLLRKQSLLIRLLCLRFIYLQLFTHIFTSLPLYSTLLYTLSLSVSVFLSFHESGVSMSTTGERAMLKTARPKTAFYSPLPSSPLSDLYLKKKTSDFKSEREGGVVSVVGPRKKLNS